MKTGTEIKDCLSTPRELCKECDNWLTQDDVGLNDFPHCSEGKDCCRRYLLGETDECNSLMIL